MSLVLDSSVAVAWVLGEEPVGRVASLIQRVVDAGAVIPSLWRLEVANALLMSTRRGRMTPDLRTAVISDLERLNLAIDAQTDRQAWSATLRLADRHGLTLYDAAYLELADRRGLPLATLDGDLIKAAETAGVAICA